MEVDNYPMGAVQAVFHGHQSQIRRMEEKVAIGRSRLEIGKLAETYCGVNVADPVNVTVIRACADLLISKYPELGIHEIHEAFSLASVRKIDADLTAYGGRFTVNMFGGVLSAYEPYRRAILAALSKGQDKINADNEAAYEAQRNAEYRATLIKTFAELQQENKEFKGSDGIPAIWAKILSEEGLLEKQTGLWRDCKNAVCAEFLAMVDDGRAKFIISSIGSYADCAKLAEEMRADPDLFPPQLQEQAKNMYSRRLVFAHLAPYTGE
jgi:hypothetical protein